ncbi:MAG: hypothetical protein ABSD53_08680 [Terriglobales bacterium]|jgi:hypothetical protein
MNDKVVLPAAVAQKEEAKPVVPKLKKASKPKPAAKKSAPKKVRKTVKKAKRKTTKPAAKKPIQRRAFPYQQVLKMWKAGKTLEKIARAVGRYQKDADDPLHSFRVSLTRFHKGVRIDGKLVKLPHRVSRKTLKLATTAGKKAAA